MTLNSPSNSDTNLPGLGDSPDFFSRIFRTKDDLFGIGTSIFIYTIATLIIITQMISDYKQGRFEIIDVDMSFISIKGMPVVMYYLVMSIMLSIIVNFFRTLLQSILEFLKMKLNGGKNEIKN